MKKFLEVLVDEDGRFHFSTDEVFTTEEEFAAENDYEKIKHMNEYDKQLARLIHDLTEFMWSTKDMNVSQAIRILSVAEVLGCAEPYERAEEFWSLMMFHTIPDYEDFAASIKKAHGFDDRNVTRPIVGGPWAGGPDILAFPFQQQVGKRSN